MREAGLAPMPPGIRVAVVAIVSIMVLTMLVVLVRATLQPVEATFNVTAQTELVTLKTTGAATSRWVLEDVEVIRDHTVARPFTGSFQLADGVEVSIERIGTGRLWIHAENISKSGGGAGTFYSATEDPLGSAGRAVEIIVRDPARRAVAGKTLVLPVTGHVSSGSQAGIQTLGGNALLRSGRVTMLVRAMFGGKVFEAGTIELDLGDEFRVSEPNPAAPTMGLVVVDERAGMTAAYRVVGRGATVTRPGGATYPVSLSLLRRVAHEPYVQGLAVIASFLAAAFGLMAAALKVASLWSERRRRVGSPQPAESP